MAGQWRPHREFAPPVDASSDTRGTVPDTADPQSPTREPDNSGWHSDSDDSSSGDDGSAGEYEGHGDPAHQEEQLAPAFHHLTVDDILSALNPSTDSGAEE